MKKIIKKMFGATFVFALAMVLVACNGDDNGDDNGGGSGVQNYTMEAEYINLDNIIGQGISNEASGVNMIAGDGTQAEKDKGWSNGYYVGFTYTALKLDFVFNSDSAETATITLRLGSEIGDITFDPNSLEVQLNGKAITYSNIFIPGSTMEDMEFVDRAITTNAQLVEGENTISVAVLSNTLRSGQTGGPMIDNIQLRTRAKLTWTDLTDNPDLRGAI